MRATLRATQLVVIIIVIRNFITWPFSSTIRTNIIHAIEIGILIQTKNTFHFHPAENEEEGDWMTPMEILSFLQTKTKDRLSINKVALFGRALHKLGISSRRKTRGTEYHVVKKE
ncbi:DUF3874-containing protein of unknown function [Bacteroides uniformis]|nr:DUF3874 domain-containing protein [Bacteroides uniformis]MCB6666665.1 DUF3874 domain-containing protein [Bacteroides uniformis]MCG4803144.1 DUF3874 domain-containing protein [Bacteroides uniformis]QUT62518.1 DUF3874-containing protein of unknown function [Bacteroides uniformis]